MPQPWEIGDDKQRWNGYLDDRYPIDPAVGQHVLRNKVGATTYAELRDHEDQAVNLRAVSLEGHGIPESYDLDGLKAIHGHLFQDIYEWAGEIRTVDIAKGPFFAPPSQAEERLEMVAWRIQSEDRFIGHDHDKLARALADVYAEVNQAHPFREGNGRTQRVYLDALAAESGHGLNWESYQGFDNDYASEQARAKFNREPLYYMFTDMLHARDDLAPQHQTGSTAVSQMTAAE